MKVHVVPSSRDFDTRADEPVLTAALRQHLNLPHSCKGGSCGTCRVRVISGRFAYPHGRPMGITEAEEATGHALICQARALEDLVIETREIRHVTDVEIKSLPCRIERMQKLAADVMGVWLRWPAIEPFTWQCGQYVDVMLPGERRRSYSLANPPHDAAFLELHVRRVPGGAFSERLFSELGPGSLLHMEGPLGQFVYRPGERPALMIGGGTGYAPLKAMLRQVLETEARRDVTFFWGARTAADLYEHEWLRAVESKHPRFRYCPVVSEQDAGQGYEHGLVHEAVLRRIPGLAGFDIYAAGPPAMVEAVRATLPPQGADPERIYFDSFEFAPS